MPPNRIEFLYSQALHLNTHFMTSRDWDKVSGWEKPRPFANDPINDDTGSYSARSPLHILLFFRCKRSTGLAWRLLSPVPIVCVRITGTVVVTVIDIRFGLSIRTELMPVVFTAPSRLACNTRIKFDFGSFWTSESLWNLRIDFASGSRSHILPT